ncbi:nitroreductase [Diaporthe helianthi]|uniref:Nitroreductase n=1 Tax=Diaporthe helianthi TaxID=158607 RepID=A0A2P5IA59_DIAHE|nr:nitroreductase [Diaporthe helianthi]
MNTARFLTRPASFPLRTIITTSTNFSRPLAVAAAAAAIKATAPPTARLFSTTNTTNNKMASAQQLIDLAKQRRSYYPLSKDLSITPEKIQQIVKDLLQEIPSSFNSQSNRVVVLFGAEHEKLWDITSEILKPIVPAEQWEGTAGKMAMFKGAAGSVLFYEDQDVVNGMQEKFALYADRFPVWAGHSDAMLQFGVWTALEAEGLGANLQHYNPLIDNRVAAEWKVPASWKLQAQLVFGGKTGAAGEKTYSAIDTKFKAYGA